MIYIRKVYSYTMHYVKKKKKSKIKGKKVNKKAARCQMTSCILTRLVWGKSIVIRMVYKRLPDPT